MEFVKLDLHARGMAHVCWTELVNTNVVGAELLPLARMTLALSSESIPGTVFVCGSIFRIQFRKMAKIGLKTWPPLFAVSGTKETVEV